MGKYEFYNTGSGVLLRRDLEEVMFHMSQARLKLSRLGSPPTPRRPASWGVTVHQVTPQHHHDGLPSSTMQAAVHPGPDRATRTNLEQHRPPLEWSLEALWNALPPGEDAARIRIAHHMSARSVPEPFATAGSSPTQERHATWRKWGERVRNTAGRPKLPRRLPPPHRKLADSERPVAFGEGRE
jgi:hypothetical protein